MATVGQLLRRASVKALRPSLAIARTLGDRRATSSVIRGMRGARFSTDFNADHLSAAMNWLCAAQDAVMGGGVSAYYDLARQRWAPAYPETTGYIIPTFLDYAGRSGDECFRARALRMADWLLTLQLENGAFPIGPLWPHWPRSPLVFDTGQIIHGLVRAHAETGDRRYLQAARRAGDWLAEVQEPDGSWRQFDYLDHAHTYSARVAWALLQLDEVRPEDRYREAADRNLAWIRNQQHADGWFANAAFSPDEAPLTHTIAYTIQGLLEAGILLRSERLCASARLAADALKRRLSTEGYLRGTYGPGWRSTARWGCLTGDAQIAQIWLRLYQITGDESYRTSALQTNDYVKQRQMQRTGLVGLDGGIAGSYPIHADYQSFQFINWAPKFFADSLMLEDTLNCRAETGRPSASTEPVLVPGHGRPETHGDAE